MSSNPVEIGGRLVGPGHPTYVIAEIGINHNGDLDTALRLVDVAVDAGCDAVKFQKRTPELCVPPDQQSRERDTPWGRITYLDYRRRVEFGVDEFRAVDEHCRRREVHWFASCWDVPSLEFVEMFQPPCYKVASACLTDRELVARTAETGRPLIVSTGMSTGEEIARAVEGLDRTSLLLAHTTSTYPCPAAEINLRMMKTLADEYGVVVGYSGHEVGLQVTLAAVAMGAAFVERHVTLDRAMWGSDHAASVEPGGLSRLVRDIRVIEAAMGDGVKRVYESELPIRAKLRRVR